MKFREHRGGLDESLKTLKDLPDRAALVAHVRELLSPFQFDFADDELLVLKYLPDPRIGWDPQYIVRINRYGVIGFTDDLPR